MKNQLIRLVLAAVMLSSISLIRISSVYAYPTDGKEMKDRKWDKQKWEEKIKEVQKELGVTPEQEEKLKVNREKMQEKMKALRDQLKEKRDALRLELDKPDFNEANVRALHQELKKLMDQKEDIWLDGILEVRKILTPDQFKKFMEMKEKRKGMGQGFGHGFGGERSWKHDKDDDQEK